QGEAWIKAVHRGAIWVPANRNLAGKKVGDVAHFVGVDNVVRNIHLLYRCLKVLEVLSAVKGNFRNRRFDLMHPDDSLLGEYETTSRKLGVAGWGHDWAMDAAPNKAIDDHGRARDIPHVDLLEPRLERRANRILSGGHAVEQVAGFPCAERAQLLDVR